MLQADPKKPLIEFKGNSLPVIAIILRSLNPASLKEAANALLSERDFFDGDAALLELSQLGDESEADWEQVKEIFRHHGLRVIGVRGGKDELQRSATAAGLPFFVAMERVQRPSITSEVIVPPPVEVTAPPASAPVSAPTMVIDRPLRSGQQIYARGGDLVILGAVNAGAEVIADGSIHIYAPLRGRALAGASGATDARIFTTRFEAELVSIAGVYRTFETDIPLELAGKPVQVQLSESTQLSLDGEANGTTSKLTIEPLNTN
ncbi:MAG: septum site-determining protein MinC [Methylophilaceae bacterium]|nr:septum site-determining protein MinC [Methylophilaceae bacterium]